jgi:hypothetical protein
MHRVLKIAPYFLLFALPYLLSANNPSKDHLDKRYYEEHRKDLRVDYGQNKIIPNDVELAALVALSKYPELKDTKIEFIYRKQKEIMVMKPKSFITFRPKSERIYRIYMTSNEDPCRGITINEIPFDALVGVFGHELAHVLDFKDQSSYTNLVSGWKYSISEKYRAKVERSTDIVTIDHDLGYQLYQIREVLDGCDFLPKKETGKELKAYLTREEILRIIENKKEQDSIPTSANSPSF